jgi:hypothetical protein
MEELTNRMENAPKPILQLAAIGVGRDYGFDNGCFQMAKYETSLSRLVLSKAPTTKQNDLS